MEQIVISLNDKDFATFSELISFISDQLKIALLGKKMTDKKVHLKEYIPRTRIIYQIDCLKGRKLSNELPTSNQ